jgi:PST family polysaccharide transporter
VGIYSSFEKLILAAKNMFIPIYQALYPFMSRQTPKGMHFLIKKIAPGIFLLGCGIVAIFFFFSDLILDLLYNDLVILEYSYLFKIMSVIALFSGLHMMYNVLYAPAAKLFKKLMWLMIGVGIFNLILSLCIVPVFYMEGTVAAVVITEFVLMVLCMFFYWKDLKTFRFTVSNR